MIFQTELKLKPKVRGFHLVTDEIISQLTQLPQTGILNVFIQHTSASLTINENADPSVRVDFENSLNQLIKEDEPFYTHTDEGSDDMPAHIKTSLMSVSLQIPITNGKLNLGLWQGIYLCEFRNNGGRRNLILTVYGE